jgi:hypothetical protein
MAPNLTDLNGLMTSMAPHPVNLHGFVTSAAPNSINSYVLRRAHANLTCHGLAVFAALRVAGGRPEVLPPRAGPGDPPNRSPEGRNRPPPGSGGSLGFQTGPKRVGICPPGEINASPTQVGPTAKRPTCHKTHPKDAKLWPDGRIAKPKRANTCKTNPVPAIFLIVWGTFFALC